MRSSLPLVLLILAALALPVRAAPGDYPAVLRALRDQFVARGFQAEGSDAECRTEAAETILRSGLAPFLADPALARMDPVSRLAGVTKAAGRSLREFDGMALANAYAAAGGDRARFLTQLRQVAADRRFKVDWTSPPVERALDRVYRELRDLADVNFNLTHSARYEDGGWMVDVRSAWYPLAGEVHVFLVGTSSCEGGGLVRSSILNLSGRTSSLPAGGYAVKLGEPVFEVRCCETRLSGEWTDRAGGVLVASTLSLKVVGHQASGRMVQILAGEGVKGRVVYQLQGGAEEGDRMAGTFQASGDPEAMRILLGRSAEAVSGTWNGRLAGGQAEGSLTADGGRTQVWKARVVESGS